MKTFVFGVLARRGWQGFCFVLTLAVLFAAVPFAFAAKGTDVTEEVAAAVKDNKLAIDAS
ncbi:MAG: hypothetical protein JWM11_1605, partial [Planctomycetaceae bacterium]|nr:hypothetical protein [Planctomycetaceae bacterium]